MANGFRIISLRLKGNYIFEDLYVEFTDKQDLTGQIKEPYTTLVIGPNGTGKSNLLRTLIELFAQLNEFKQKKPKAARVHGDFCLEFLMGGDRYTYFNRDFKDVEDTKRRPRVHKNGVSIEPMEIPTPGAVIGLSIMLTDKFPIEIEDYEEYTYLGVRANASTARTTSFVNKTIDLLYQTLDDAVVKENISRALTFIGYEPKLFVSYYPRYKPHFFSGNLTVALFEDFFVNFQNYTKRAEGNPPWSQAIFFKLKETESVKIAELVDLCNKLSGHLEFDYPGSRSQYFEFDVFESYLTDREVSLLRSLHRLDIISYPQMGFYKHDKYFVLSDSSSGEYHFISGFIGLLAKIKENSLILIDEPENSLHPNWQMKYISFFKKIFARYGSCHAILTSHSHFLVSDLEKESSAIVGLSKDKAIAATTIPANTFGWSAEEILLKIFNTASTRNYYLAEQLGEIFELISQGATERDLKQIKLRVRDLRKLDLSGLSKEDPLKDVISTLFEKFADA